jgi:lipoate-protein ligase A
VQYAFGLAHHLDQALESIDGSKRFCNGLLRRALFDAGVRQHLDEDRSGDLLLDGRKVAGLALRRRRRATLLHGSILCRADHPLLARVLRHPPREPAYRAGRAHRDFLADLGNFDLGVFRAGLAEAVAQLPSAP